MSLQVQTTPGAPEGNHTGAPPSELRQADPAGSAGAAEAFEAEDTISIELNFNAFSDHTAPTQHARRVARETDPTIQDFADQALELAALRAELKRLARDYDALQNAVRVRDSRLLDMQQELSVLRTRARNTAREVQEMQAPPVAAPAAPVAQPAVAISAAPVAQPAVPVSAAPVPQPAVAVAAAPAAPPAVAVSAAPVTPIAAKATQHSHAPGTGHNGSAVPTLDAPVVRVQDQSRVVPTLDTSAVVPSEPLQQSAGHASSAPSIANDTPVSSDLSSTVELPEPNVEATATTPEMPAFVAEARPARTVWMRQLIPLDRPGDPVPLTRDIMTIGRTRANDICVLSRAVSRDHARLVMSARGVTVFDMASANGCFVNDEPIKRHKLRDGDVLRIGDRSYRYVSEPQTP